MIFRRLLIIFILTYTRIAYAGDPNPIHYLGIEHGLSNNAVTCIYQDYNGFMWFGTYDGLNKYDGYGFKIFRNIIGDSASLKDNHIYTIEGDGDHKLWIGGAKGISIYNPALSVFSYPRFWSWNMSSLKNINEGVGIIKSINRGEQMLAGTNNGLLIFEKNSLSGMQIPLYSFKGQEGKYTVTAIEFDSLKQSAWVFVQQAGLCQFNLKTRTLTIVDHSIKEANCMKSDNWGNLWIGNNNGLYKYNTRSHLFSENLMPSKNSVAGLFVDRQSIVWIASDGGGVWLLPQGSMTPVPYLSNDGNALVNSNAVYAIYEDMEGRKWIGTLRGGINIIQPQTSSFRNITYTVPGQNNIINNFILSFCEDEKSNVWIGTDGAGLRYWYRDKNKSVQYINTPPKKNSISSNFITSILRDSRNTIWISTWFGGINRVTSNAGTFDHYTCFNPTTNAEENNVWLIYEDKQQRIWASTTNNGTLYLFNRQSNKFELFDESIVNIQCLVEDSENNFWGGNYTSLLNIDRTQKKHHDYNIGYPVRCIHEDKNKNFWIGTEGGGLLLFDRTNGSYQRYTTSEGLPSNTILRFLEDSLGNLWFSTYNGLCKFNPSTKAYRNFSQSDGLQSNQFSFNAALALKTGEFLFGGIKGFNIFYPDSVYDKKETPRIFLTGLKINNAPVEDRASYITKREFEKIHQVTLPYDQAIVSLDFVALEYTGADKIKYAYFLEGWDKNWNYVNGIRAANYSRLEEGNYTFKIKVTNADGIWGEETQLLKIIVLPPWYRTWWAYLAYGLFVVTAIYLYIQYNKRQERLRYEIKLAHLEKETEKELTEKRISFFTHISHEFRTPLTLIINPLKELVKGKANGDSQKDISMIYRNARRLLSLVDQLLLFRKVESVDQQMRVERFDIVEVCHEVFLSFSQHAVSKKINFVYNRSEHEIFIYADKEKIEIILFNLVSNAFKYTHSGGGVTLVIFENEKDIEIEVKDTGSGIPADVGNKLFDSFYQANNKDKASQSGFGVGLYVSQKLALAHQGRLSYSSEPGKGTQFNLILLKGKQHFPSQLISEDYKGGETILHELVEEPVSENYPGDEEQRRLNKSEVIDKLTSDLPTMVIVDDNAEIRSYVRQVFAGSFIIYEADDGKGGYELVIKETPDIVISDVMMKNIGGVELCKKIKATPSIAHTPVILLTASSSDEAKLEGIEGGAEDYITKPFDREIIVARVQNILKGRNRLQQYFFNAVTLKPNSNIAGEHKEFIEKCMMVVENHLDNPDFTIQMFCRQIGMSHPSLYKKVKAVSGLTVNVFVRYLRLRKAAELLINTDKTIVEVTYITGFNDIRYFREQFYNLFGMNPSDYVKRYRKVLGNKAVGQP
jgi:signal transduction histidine kinase/ligand-binding sensor domain-containing protein/DNA-binding response OmpR family regulator